ncbi:glutamate-5-semialdehyde dehydrogenase [Alkalicoccus saliphilus]|uniref:Gamma-glutamyl phosphate reductase n=1 Tax=Alkalicoccus saliphilus TaxID=200989 RepID=A0A2T4U825_9BACI|nr:glutamate-5-semialdehyde dehydrogenase [Alkalicoccus saliphilus]PTL39549.1 glutamate-5-semialdehyde dehydrogenase [Alkalicoccus saliphilus]
MQNEVLSKAQKAKSISSTLAGFTQEDRSALLLTIADKLNENAAYILQENSRDVEQAKKNKVSDALIDRLRLNEERLKAITEAVRDIASLPDPTGEILWEEDRPNGLHIKQVRVPIGVIGVIYEARPNVTVDISSLALKTGNTVLLRGSSSTIHSNKAITSVIQKALETSGFPPESVQLIENTDRTLTKSLFTAREYIDVIIPRGGKALIDTVVRESEVPVIETGAGNCHIYIDESAEEKLARTIAVDAKVQRPSVCNACETFLIHESWAESHLTALTGDLLSHGVTLKGDATSRALDSRIEAAEDADWDTEFLALTAAVKIVSGVQEAVSHIQKHGTKHSEAVLTETPEVVEAFFNQVDASTLYHNASTRFTDGFEFGFGAEVGISTQKLHARGAMGLPALTTTKYLVQGSGQTKGNLPLHEKH